MMRYRTDMSFCQMLSYKTYMSFSQMLSYKTYMSLATATSTSTTCPQIDNYNFYFIIITSLTWKKRKQTTKCQLANHRTFLQNQCLVFGCFDNPTYLKSYQSKQPSQTIDGGVK